MPTATRNRRLLTNAGRHRKYGLVRNRGDPRGSAETRVTPELALAVGRAVAAEVRAAEEGTRPDEVVLARDGRVTGPAIAAAMESGLASGGRPVLRAGGSPDPALAHASPRRDGTA